jgi:hypothetical protein
MIQHMNTLQKRGMEYTHPTHPTHHIHGLYWDQDSADSLLSESEVANEEFSTRHGVSDEPDEQSECSENSANMSNEIYGSSVHSDQQSEAMHMACIQEVHHYWVKRELDGGEPHPEYEDVDEDYMLRDVSASPMLFEDRDGQLWSYEDEIIPCNNAQEYVNHQWRDTRWSLRFQNGSRIQTKEKVALNMMGKMMTKRMN